jgi:flagellar biosynthesis protein
VLAQALSAVGLDDQIPEELYRAVAQVIAFVLSLRGEVRGAAARHGHHDGTTP